MILIFSDENDISTDNVIEWLHKYGVIFKRINNQESDFLCSILIEDNDVKISFKDKTFNIDEVNFVWYRRGYLTFSYPFYTSSLKSNPTKYQIFNQINREAQTISDFIYHYLDAKKIIGRPDKYNTNKLESLTLAAKVGLRVPDTLVTGVGDSVKRFKNNRLDGIITKSLSNNIEFDIEEKSFGAGTRSVNDISDRFYYSLFQEKIDRFCELRIFFLDDEYFAMAIFVDTALTDVRALTLGNNKARLVPFKLPEDILQKLKTFTKLKGLNTGSIDMILTLNSEYIFLEINPVGQYEYLEYSCNYPISETIAKKMAAYERNIQ